MTQFYGQSNPKEDAIAAAVFDDDFIGTAVEVGAFDGIRLSNCYHFYLKGWRCINFEPHPENYAKLEANQPNALNFQYAVSSGMSAPKRMTMQTAPGKPMVTGFDLPDWYVKSEVPSKWDGIQALDVLAVSLDKILYNHHIQSVDYISIDVDGTELDVLNGFNLNRYQPRLMIIEYNHALKEMTDYLSSCGYTLAHTNLFNGFWTRTQVDCDAVRRAVQS